MYLIERSPILIACALAIATPAFAHKYLGHDRNRPLPPVVTPAVTSSETQAGKAPSDAIVLFDGSSLDAWVATDGSPTKWVIKDGAMECVPGSGYIRTQEAFGECQLHIEFATPDNGRSSQGGGNSGVFFGGERYEVQVLNSYQNKTYADGSCASIYNQFPPEVNASLPPGKWQTYDIIWTPPSFDADGKCTAPAYLTVFHNGVLVHNRRALIGETGWLERPPFTKHPEKLPISLQDHGDPVRYRNVWVRPLGSDKRRDFVLPQATLDRYVGFYKGEHSKEADTQILRKGDSLLLKMYGTEIPLRTGSATHFYGNEVDIQINFTPDGKSLRFSVGEGEGDLRKKVE
ncbi:MAG: DUF1080 domain-containing protein [Opitutaceae bacterium]|nr:DUF1080 domain-containing protein [Opitutaceae bacterium]